MISSGDLDIAEQVAAAASGVDGVVGLHGGPVGGVATYLPGRRVDGVRVTPSGVEVRLTVAWGEDARRVGEQVRAAVQQVRPGDVDVVIADVAEPQATSQRPPRRGSGGQRAQTDKSSAQPPLPQRNSKEHP